VTFVQEVLRSLWKAKFYYRCGKYIRPKRCISTIPFTLSSCLVTVAWRYINARREQHVNNWFSTLRINSIYKHIRPVHLYLSVIIVRGFSTVGCTYQELLESLMVIPNLLMEIFKCCWDKNGGQAPCRTNCSGSNKLHSHRESGFREIYICI